MNRRERKKEKTKDNIIDCAVGFFKEKGFKQTSMEEIAEKSDVSKGTLYNYFQDKESILVGYFQSIIADYSVEIYGSFEEHKDLITQLNKLLELVYHIFQNDMILAGIYFRYRLQTLFDHSQLDLDKQRSGLESLVLEIIKEGQRNKELRSDIPIIIIARNIQFLLINFFVTSLHGQENSERDLLKSQLINLFLDGVRL
ncbi:MAG TPA: TetR/AcrR family transcriptional regulator [Desulfosporosinus sp.]|nr:TetR/AcrR family transcriptional regulator [Desulfosporosinus sp.]